MIILKDITKDYRVGNHKVRALKGISMKFRQNEFVCIHGPSGCGKTTLLNIIGGLDRYTNGRLFINDQETSKFKDGDWDSYRNQSVGFVFQNYYLLPQLTVFENVEMSLTLVGIPKQQRKYIVMQALDRVGLTKEYKNLPKQLSGGQMQRVAIARAIVNDPDIVLADEPTGAIDSVTADVIMKILKDISKDRLVVLVSHNLELSKRYGTRIVEMLDGNLIADTNPVNKPVIGREYKKKKTSMSFFSTLKLSIKNLLRTKLRTPLTIFAGCIGIIGVGLVLSISKGVNVYIEEVQKTALGNYPITISSSVKVKDKQTGEEVKEKELFPDSDFVTVLTGQRDYDHYNFIENDFLDYLDDMDSELYTIINYNTSIKMNILSHTDTGYKKISQSQFYELNTNDAFVLEQYDVLSGKLPQEANEVALVIDKYNSIDALTLYYLGFDYEGIDTYSFEDLLNKEFKLISNNDFYTKIDDKYTYKSSLQYEQLYEDSTETLKVSGIIRVNPIAKTELYSTGLLYTPKLTELVLNDSLTSDIVIEQLEFGISKDVFTGLPYEEKVSFSSTTSPEYQYEETLVNLGSQIKTTRLYVYTSSFEDRLLIQSYVNAYTKEDSNINITYYDYMNIVTTEFASLVKVFSTVLIIFSSVSLIVSSIMIGIITYVSVIERTREIGILRSIGARKKDISRLFNVETLIIGLFSGFIGIIGVLLLLDPVNLFVQKMIQEYTVSFSGITKLIVARFEFKYVIILLFGSMILTLLAGFIPSKIASRKAPIDALKSER